MAYSYPNKLLLDVTEEMLERNDMDTLLMTTQGLSTLQQTRHDNGSSDIQDTVKDPEQSTIIYLTMNNDIEAVEKILRKRTGKPEEYRDEYGTALQIAVEKVYPEMVQLLLYHGADPNYDNKSGSYYVTPLCSILSLIHSNVISNGTYPIHEINIAQQLVEARADLSMPDSVYVNALQYPGVGHVPELVITMLDTGLVDINGRNWEGLTILQQLIIKCPSLSIDLVEGLLRRGINIDLRDLNGCSAIFHAWKLDDGVRFPALMMAYGCDMNIRAFAGKTVFHHIAECTNYGRALRCMKQVLSSKKPCLVHLKDLTGRTAADYAQLNGNWELVDLLKLYEFEG